VIFDTGSSWLWVQTPNCTNCMSMGEYAFDPLTSDSLNRTGRQMKLGYGSGDVTGEILNDVVCLNKEATMCAQMNFVGVNT